jgi:hypothetical protein
MPPTSQLPSPTPANDQQVTDLLTALVSGTTGLPPALVRPRWQPTPPAQPPATTAWCSVGIVNRSSSDYPWEGQATLPGSAGTEAVLQRRWSSFEVVASFYGPGADDLAEQFRDAAYRNTNLADLSAAGIKLTFVGDITSVPDLINQQFIDHSDVRLTFAREIQRYYPGQSVIEVTGTLTATDVDIVIPLVDQQNDVFVADWKFNVNV